MGFRNRTNNNLIEVTCHNNFTWQGYVHIFPPIPKKASKLRRKAWNEDGYVDGTCVLCGRVVPAKDKRMITLALHLDGRDLGVEGEAVLVIANPFTVQLNDDQWSETTGSLVIGSTCAKKFPKDAIQIYPKEFWGDHGNETAK